MKILGQTVWQLFWPAGSGYFKQPTTPLRQAEFLTQWSATASIKVSSTLQPQNRPRRLAWPRTSPFHGGNTGSNPVGDANNSKDLQKLALLNQGPFGSNRLLECRRDRL
jgi:hypothetical protein